jgi:Zn-dependent protease
MYSDARGNLAKNEVFEFVKAWLGISAAFTVLLSYRYGHPLLQAILVAALTAGVGFVLHELGHRVVARHFGCDAHFLANDSMLVVSILMAFTGFLFAAPGAVWHSGYVTKRQGGLIAAAGPIVNMVLAVLFLIPLLVAKDPTVILFTSAGYQINAWLGLFNMIPFGPIDGAKIWQWNQVVFGVMAAVAILEVFFLLNLLQNVL